MKETKKNTKEVKKDKKTIVLMIIGCLLCVAFLGIFIFSDVMPNLKENEESNKIINEFRKKFNSKERNVLYYASDECSYCQLQSPILEELEDEYEFDYYYIDKTKLSSTDKKEILDTLEIEDATPTTIIVENGKVVDTAVGYVEGNEITAFFIENEILEEDAVYPGEKYLNVISFTEYKRLIASNGTNVVVIGQTGCSHCTAIKPALNKVSEKYGVEINYLNMTNLEEDESDEFMSTLTQIQYNDPDFVESGSFGTPLTLIVTNGKVEKYISGSRTTSQLAREFRKIGLIKE